MSPDYVLHILQPFASDSSCLPPCQEGQKLIIASRATYADNVFLWRQWQSVCSAGGGRTDLQSPHLYDSARRTKTTWRKPMSQPSTFQQETRNRSPSPSAQHVRSNCECRILQAPVDDISELIEGGDVPVLSIEAGDSDKLSLHAKPYNGDLEYVVISSLVPNFLSLSTYQTLTTCQLMRLALPLGRLQGECSELLSFWFSDLCLPDGEQSRMSRLGEIYSNAYAVLVVDPEFMRLSSTGEQDLRTYLPALYRRQPQLAMSRRILLMAGGSFVDVQAALTRSRNSVRIGHRHSLSSASSLSRSASKRSKPGSRETRSL